MVGSCQPNMQSSSSNIISSFESDQAAPLAQIEALTHICALANYRASPLPGPHTQNGQVFTFCRGSLNASTRKRTCALISARAMTRTCTRKVCVGSSRRSRVTSWSTPVLRRPHSRLLLFPCNVHSAHNCKCSQSRSNICPLQGSRSRSVSSLRHGTETHKHSALHVM
jgi:hypothetical protein